MCSTNAHQSLRGGNLAGKWSFTVPLGSLSTPVVTWHLYTSEIIFPICMWAKCHHNRWTWVYITGKLCIYIKYADYEHESFLGTSKHLSALSFCVYCLHHMPSQWEGLVGDAKRSTHEFHENCFIGLICLTLSKRNTEHVLCVSLLLFQLFQENTFYELILVANKWNFWAL